MKNKCLYCNSPVENKYCNVSCQNKHQNSQKSNTRYGFFKQFKVQCFKCEKSFEVEEREFLFPQKKKYFCSRSCANTRIHSNQTIEKIRNSCQKIIKKPTQKILNKQCLHCKKEFYKKTSITSVFCSIKCRSVFYSTTGIDLARVFGRKSALKNGRKSKNEIYFSELCQTKFSNVLINGEILFNGWDADVVLPDLKIAILWNGKWHYEKLAKKHSVEKVQEKDSIKEKEIEKCNYYPYIIKDMGKFNKKFVENQFEIFLDFINKEQ